MPPSPNVTASTPASSASMEITTSPSQASATVGAGVAPRSANAATLSGDLLYAVTSWPAFNKLAAMPEPMFPRPMNPILIAPQCRTNVRWWRKSRMKFAVDARSPRRPEKLTSFRLRASPR